jgi:DNA (cytosine-5)-methyltransferase 1
VVDGLPDPLEPARVRALGNAVVPAVAEYIGRLILAQHQGVVAKDRSAVAA